MVIPQAVNRLRVSWLAVTLAAYERTLNNQEKPTDVLQLRLSARDLQHLLFAWSQQLKEAGELRKDQSPEDLTEVILGSFVHAQLTWLITKSTDSLTDRVSRWLDIVLQGCGQKTKQDLAHSQS